jgi:hypothetical protein
MTSFARRLNALLSMVRESWKQRGKGKPRKQRSCGLGRTRLSLEALEARELLSANLPSFSLSNGNLYNTTISSTQPIDAGVQNFVAVNTQVFDHHTNGACQLTVQRGYIDEDTVFSGNTRGLPRWQPAFFPAILSNLRCTANE